MSLRTVERAVAPLRHALRAAARATVRFETRPGEQLQIGFGERTVAALEAHLAQWTRDVADVRMHGTTGEAPIARFTRDEASTLTPLASRASFQPTREWMRRVQVDGTIELHRNWYSVPWRYLGETVRVQQHGECVTITYGAAIIADHHVAVGTRVRRVDPAHLVGITARAHGEASAERVLPSATLLRPLAEYGIAAGETLCEVAA